MDNDSIINIPQHLNDEYFREIVAVLKMQYLINIINETEVEILIPNTNKKVNVSRQEDGSIKISGLKKEDQFLVFNDKLASAKCAHQIEKLIIENFDIKEKPSCLGLYVYIIILSIILAAYCDEKELSSMSPLPKNVAYILFDGICNNDIIKKYEFKATKGGDISIEKWEENNPNLKSTYSFNVEEWTDDADRITDVVWSFFSDLKKITKISKG